jgi:aspartate/methionine/tyrosine aminotransferase
MRYFPYMEFARTRAHLARHILTQSGMPPPEASLELRAASALVDSGYAGIDALPELERHIAARLKVDPRRVIVTLGATGGMHLAAWRFFRPGSTVASETPSYEPLRALPRAFGAQVALIERDPLARWQLQPQSVRRALHGAQPGHVFLTNPNNPTGALLSGETLRELAQEAERCGGVLVSCEVYLEFEQPELRQAAFRMAPNAISISSLTKAYGLGGLRLGWMVLGEGLVHERESLMDLAYLTYVDLPTPALRAGLLAFERLEELRAPIAQVNRESRPLLLEWLERTPGVSAERPDLGLSAFPSIEGVGDTTTLADYLLKEHGVGVVPGEFFGRPGHLRIGCGLPPSGLSAALEQLGRGLEAFRKSR